MTPVVPVAASAPGVRSPRVEAFASFDAAAHRRRAPLCMRRHVDFGRMHSSACRSR